MALTLVWIKPKVPSNGKAVVMVVSGSWFSGYNGIEISSSSAEKFLTKGYEVFAVVHGSQPRYAIPDAVNDIKRAVRYIRYNASRFGIDPNKIGITGGSAAGHLSLVVATADEDPNPAAPDPVDRVSSRVQAVAVLYPPTDFLNWGGRGINLINAKEILKMNRTWGAADFKVWNERFSLYEEVTDTAARNKIAKEVSPLYFVSPDDPPVFIIHGDADSVVPLQQSQTIVTRLIETGEPNRFVIKKGGKHNSDQMNPEWEEFADWFDKYLK
jgi:acetyl esterase/lipase